MLKDDIKLEMMVMKVCELAELSFGVGSGGCDFKTVVGEELE